MRGWQVYPSEKSWFSIHFPRVNHTLHYTGAPEWPAVVGKNLHLATHNLPKSKNNLLAHLAWWKALAFAKGGGKSRMLAQYLKKESRRGICNSDQNILLPPFFSTETLTCVSHTSIAISTWMTPLIVHKSICADWSRAVNTYMVRREALSAQLSFYIAFLWCCFSSLS